MNKNQFFLFAQFTDSSCLTTLLSNVFWKKLGSKIIILHFDFSGIFKDRNLSISELQKNIIKSPV